MIPLQFFLYSSSHFASNHPSIYAEFRDSRSFQANELLSRIDFTYEFPMAGGITSPEAPK